MRRSRPGGYDLQFAIPAGALPAIAGILAAILPARRAARLRSPRSTPIRIVAN